VFSWRYEPIFCIFFRTIAKTDRFVTGVLSVTNSTEHSWSETHTSEADDGQVNEVQIRQCLGTYATGMLQVCNRYDTGMIQVCYRYAFLVT